MNNFLTVSFYTLFMGGIAFMIWRHPSTRLLIQKHPLIISAWLATAFTVIIAIIIRHWGRLDPVGILILEGFVFMSGAVIMEVRKAWGTPKQITSLLLGISIHAFIGMIIFSMLI